MKKMFPAMAFVLAVLMALSVTSAFADNSTAPAEGSEPVDPLVGAWMMPPSPFGENYRGYVVLNADGSFLNATNFYEADSATGPYTQQVTTNESFTWVRTGSTTLELHYDYHDDNGEFVTELDYDPETDSLYFWGSLYAVRDNTFELQNELKK